MQKYLIQSILSPLCKIMSRFSEKAKNRLFVLGGVGIVILTFLRHSEAVDYRYLYHFTGCCFGLGLMILGSLDDAVKPVRFRRAFTAIWFTFGLLQLRSGICNSSNYLPEAVLLLVAYPILFICWNNTDRTRLYRLLGRVLRISLWIFAAASWLLSPIGKDKYPGIFTNTNNAAYFLCLCAVSALLGLMYEQGRKETFTNILDLALACALNYYTNSRTGTLAILLALAFGLGIFLLRHDRRENLTCLTRLAAGALAIFVAMHGLVYIYQLRHYLPLPYFDGDEKGVYYATREELLEEAEEEDFFGLSGFQDVSDKKNNTAGKDLDAYSTGRVSIWLAYAKDLNLTGHEGVPPKYIPGYDKEFESTHMTCLQIAYESGIPTGLIFLLLNLASGIGTVWYAWKHGRGGYASGPVMFTVVFGVLSMLGSCGASFGYLTTFLYYLSQYPIIACLQEESPC